MNTEPCVNFKRSIVAWQPLTPSQLSVFDADADNNYESFSFSMKLSIHLENSLLIAILLEHRFIVEKLIDCYWKYFFQWRKCNYVEWIERQCHMKCPSEWSEGSESYRFVLWRLAWAEWYFQSAVRKKGAPFDLLLWKNRNRSMAGQFVRAAHSPMYSLWESIQRNSPAITFNLICFIEQLELWKIL